MATASRTTNPNRNNVAAMNIAAIGEWKKFWAATEEERARKKHVLEQKQLTIAQANMGSIVQWRQLRQQQLITSQQQAQQGDTTTNQENNAPFGTAAVVSVNRAKNAVVATGNVVANATLSAGRTIGHAAAATKGVAASAIKRVGAWFPNWTATDTTTSTPIQMVHDILTELRNSNPDAETFTALLTRYTELHNDDGRIPDYEKKCNKLLDDAMRALQTLKTAAATNSGGAAQTPTGENTETDLDATQNMEDSPLVTTATADIQLHLLGDLNTPGGSDANALAPPATDGTGTPESNTPGAGTPGADIPGADTQDTAGTGTSGINITDTPPGADQPGRDTPATDLNDQTTGALGTNEDTSGAQTALEAAQAAQAALEAASVGANAPSGTNASGFDRVQIPAGSMESNATGTEFYKNTMGPPWKKGVYLGGGKVLKGLDQYWGREIVAVGNTEDKTNDVEITDLDHYKRMKQKFKAEKQTNKTAYITFGQQVVLRESNDSSAAAAADGSGGEPASNGSGRDLRKRKDVDYTGKGG